ncbi:MAG: glycosyl hydrolase 108 family protein [Ferruginibacter sp.]
MNNFEALFQSVMQNELGYNPNDQGAETYNGIWRKAWPLWRGWPLVDKVSNKKRGQTFYNIYPQLEELTKSFYRGYWKDVRVNDIQNLKVAKLLVDMSTQHGGWRKILHAALNNTDPLAPGAKALYTDKEISTINSSPAFYYIKLAEKRLYYSTNVFLKNEGDRKGIINRAMKYVNDAKKYLAENPGKSSGAVGLLLLTGFTFFF